MAFGSLSFSGGDMLGRFSIVLGAYLIAPAMAVYAGCVAVLGAALVYTSFFRGESEKEKSADVKLEA
jgi:MFS transporter, DHA1 family, multidrug resistance protein B